MTDIRDVLARIKDRAEEATPGPWEARMRSGVAVVPGIIAASHVRLPVKDRGTNAYEGETRHELTPLFVGEDEDAEFIAHARTDVDRLTEALEAVLTYADDTRVYDDPETGEEAGYQRAVEDFQHDVREVIENALNEEKA